MISNFDFLKTELLGYFWDFSYEEGILDIRQHYISYRYKGKPFYYELKSELELALHLNPKVEEDREIINQLVRHHANVWGENEVLRKQWLQKLYDDLFGYIEGLSEEELEAKYYEYNPKKKSMLTKLKNLFTKN